MNTVYKIYSHDGDFRGQHSDRDFAINYAMKHNFIVIDPVKRKVEWSLFIDAPVYKMLGVR